MTEENKNIFEGAKFGDKFLTRDGRIALLKDIELMTFLTEDGVTITTYSPEEAKDCTCIAKADIRYYTDSDDIVSRYEKPIKNGIIIDGVLHELVKDNELVCESCSLYSLCNTYPCCQFLFNTHVHHFEVKKGDN